MNRRKLALALVAVLALAALVALAFREPLGLALARRRLRDADPMVRHAARARLLAAGRPSCDDVLPELCALYAYEEIASGGAIAVARTIEPDAAAANRLLVRTERIVVATDARALDAGADSADLIRAQDERVSETATRLAAVVGGPATGRALVVLGHRGGAAVLRSRLSLEGDLGPKILAALDAERAARR